MQVLSNGYKLPETGDFGSTWFPALEDNIQLANDHTHDGTDGVKLSALNLTGYSATLLNTDFADQGDGYWRATVTVPNALTVDNFVVTIKDPTTKEVFYLKTAKLSATQYYVYTNIVQTFEVYYGV